MPAQAERTGGRVHAVVDEVDHPLVRKPFLVGQPQEDRNFCLPYRFDLPIADETTNPQHGPLVLVEIRVDRIHGHDRRQGRLIGLDHVGGVDELPADAALDRGVDRAEVEIQFRRLDRRFGWI